MYFGAESCKLDKALVIGRKDDIYVCIPALLKLKIHHLIQYIGGTTRPGSTKLCRGSAGSRQLVVFLCMCIIIGPYEIVQ